MSAKIKPILIADGKEYELTFTRSLQVEYQKMVNEKKQDEEYQRDISEYTRLENEYKEIDARYAQAKADFYDDPLDEDKEKKFNKLKTLCETAFNAFNEFGATHKAADEAQEYSLYMLGKIVLLALQEQHGLDSKQAEEVWNKFVEENGQVGSMEFLAYVGKVFLTDVDEDTENPFIKAMREKVIQADNRRAGLQTMKK